MIKQNISTEQIKSILSKADVEFTNDDMTVHYDGEDFELIVTVLEENDYKPRIDFASLVGTITKIVPNENVMHEVQMFVNSKYAEKDVEEQDGKLMETDYNEILKDRLNHQLI